jgi:hypothetical protein
MSNIVAQSASSDMFIVMEKAYKFAEIMSKSDIVPAHYRGKPENTFIAVQSAYRMNLDPMMVMQNTFVVSGKLGMSSTFAISLANSSGRLNGGITYDIEGAGENLRVTAKATLQSSGKEISYSIGMKEARAEGWTKNPKYSTLPELMLCYRAATLLIRTHMPEVLNGMHMVEELEDVKAVVNENQVITKDITPKTDRLSAKLDNIVLQQEVVQNRTTELLTLVGQYHVPQELVSKWCQKANVERLEELDEDKVASCIAHIEKNFVNHKELP